MIKVVVASAALCALVVTAALAGPPAPKKAVTIALPGDVNFAFKPGPGVEGAQRHCLTCHSSAYVSTQPLLTRAQWASEVTKMQKVYAAPIADADVAPLVEYLTTNYGKP